MTDEQKYKSANALLPYLQDKLSEYEKQLLSKIPNCPDDELVNLKYKYLAMIDLVNSIEQDIINQRIKDMKK